MRIESGRDGSSSFVCVKAKYSMDGARSECGADEDGVLQMAVSGLKLLEMRMRFLPRSNIILF